MAGAFWDGLILGGIWQVLLIPLALATLNLEPNQAALALFASGFLVNSAYFAYFHARDRATPGKRLAGIRLARLDGGDPTMAQILVREFVGRLLATLFLGVGFVPMFLRKDRRGLHDLLAGTWVVSEED